MTNAEYRAHEGVSRSELWNMRLSPEKFKYLLDNPLPSTPTQIFGSAFHKYVLEPDTFYAEYAVMPKIDKRTKDGKAQFEAFAADCGERSIINEEDFATIKAMRDKLMSTKLAYRLLSGAKEQSVFWTDDWSGERCKCRPDAITEIGGINVLVDLKTCANASTESFARDAIKYGYDLQAAMYKIGCDIAFNRTHDFVFIAIERESPYAVNIMQADEITIGLGRNKFRKYLDMYAECNRTNNWYGYNGADSAITVLTPPRWASIEIEG